MEREHYVYKYEDKYDGSVQYVGKTNCSLSARINAHAREDVFSGEYCIYFTRLLNAVETDFVEKSLINYYKPPLNIKDKVPFLTEGTFLPDLTWHPYEEYLALKKGKSPLLGIKQVTECLKAIEAIYNSDKEVMVTSLFSVWFRGKIVPLFKKVVTHKEGGYMLSPLPESYAFVLKHYYELSCENLAMFLSEKNIPENIEKEIVFFENTQDLCLKISEFATDGFFCEDCPISETLYIPAEYCESAGILAKVTETKVISLPTRSMMMFGPDEYAKYKVVHDDLFERSWSILQRYFDDITC